MWLELDEVSFPRFFDGPLRRDSEAFDAAKAFAEQHGAVLIFQGNPRVAKFGRAYAKHDDDASPQDAGVGTNRGQTTRAQGRSAH